MKTDHILIIRFSAIGDVAMTVPVVYSLAKQYPHIRITVLSRPYARPFFDKLASNVGFMEADIKGEYNGISGLNSLYSRLEAKQFTAIADFHGVIRSEYLRMRFNIGPYRVEHINKHRAGKKALTSFKNKKLEQQPTSFENYAEVLAKLGYPIKLDYPGMFPPEGGNMRLLESKNIIKKKSFQEWIGVAPFAGHPGKIYPLDKMEVVIQNIIIKHPSCRIFLFGGGEKEMKKFHEWTEKYIQCTCVADEIKGMDKELILMSHLDVMVSMDSANMHLASIVNTPVVSVWGATHPFGGFMGWNQDINNAVQLDISCRPCSIYGNKKCLRGDFICMKNITPEMINDRVEIVLKKAIK
nr:glycosyltransferase family 9 protein [Prevotella sp.]